MDTPLLKRANQALLSGHYHQARNLYQRASRRHGAELFHANIELSSRRERSRFLTPGSRFATGNPEPLITYCVPCYRRQADLETNLKANLRTLARFTGVRLMLNLFDEDDASYRWVLANCKSQIDSGLLCVNTEPALESWHASKAKNSFAKHLKDGYYSALDSDNRLTESDIVRTRQAIAEFGSCIIHHFQGEWGDGSCGRITMPVSAYQRSLACENLLPRQFEEMALLINAVGNYPSWPFISRPEANVFEKSHFLRVLVNADQWNINHIPCDLGETRRPDDATHNRYAKNNPLLSAYSRLNGYYACLLASRSKTARTEFQRRLKQVQQELETSPLMSDLAPHLLAPYAGETLAEADRRQPQIAVVHTWDEHTRRWIKKQRERGCRRFLVIHTGPNNLAHQDVSEPDVTLFKPLVGDPETFKNFWITSLTQRYRPQAVAA